MNKAMLAPAAMLVAWSLVMLVWMGRSRFAAMANSRIKLGKSRPGGRGQDLESVLPPHVMWKSHNYAHLMEQPTLFYAVVMILALAGAGPADVALAWSYTGLRVIHSVYQATTNQVRVRFAIFALSSLALMALAVRALLVTL